jgi:hypothetical protein
MTTRRAKQLFCKFEIRLRRQAKFIAGSGVKRIQIFSCLPILGIMVVLIELCLARFLFTHITRLFLF